MQVWWKMLILTGYLGNCHSWRLLVSNKRTNQLWCIITSSKLEAWMVGRVKIFKIEKDMRAWWKMSLTWSFENCHSWRHLVLNERTNQPPTLVVYYYYHFFKFRSVNGRKSQRILKRQNYASFVEDVIIDKVVWKLSQLETSGVE